MFAAFAFAAGPVLIRKEGVRADFRYILWNQQPQSYQNDTFNIGSRNGGAFFFNGELDEFRISSRLLNPAQFLIPVSYPNAGFTITQQPADVSVTENSSATFSVGTTITNAPDSAVVYHFLDGTHDGLHT